MRLVVAQISQSALNHNLRRVNQLAPHSKVMAVLKANGYGHGLVNMARLLDKADAFAVARIDEALALRAEGIVKPIVLLEGVFNPSDIPIAQASQFNLVVHSEYQLNMLEKAQLEGSIRIWLKIDTGMHRLGISPQDANLYYYRLKQLPFVDPKIRLMTHFGCADDKSNPVTEQQISLFKGCVNGLEGETCLANSAGILAWPESHGDWVRPGLMLFGVSPILNQSSVDNHLQPVMQLQSKLIAINSIQAGESTGYGGVWTAKKATRLGVVAIGYGDGYPWNAKEGTPVLINGRRVPLVGRVSMDMITVDLGEQSNDQIGDPAVLWGTQLPIEEIAHHAGTIPYELLCNVAQRVDFQYV